MSSISKSSRKKEVPPRVTQKLSELTLSVFWKIERLKDVKKIMENIWYAFPILGGLLPLINFLWPILQKIGSPAKNWVMNKLKEYVIGQAKDAERGGGRRTEHD